MTTTAGGRENGITGARSAPTEKPPLGVEPYYIPAESRIKDLAQAIWQNVDTGNTGCIRLWAREIIEQCGLIERMEGRQRNET